MKLGHIKCFMNDELELKDERLLLLHQELRLFITKSHSFNDTFNK